MPSAQAKVGTLFADLVAWMKEAMTESLGVLNLAERAAMCERSLIENLLLPLVKRQRVLWKPMDWPSPGIDWLETKKMTACDVR